MAAVSPAEKCRPQRAHEKQSTWNMRSRARITNSVELRPVPQRAHLRDENSLKA